MVHATSRTNRFSVQESTTVEPGTVSGDVSESPSWTPSYSTTVQGSSPHFQPETIPKGDSEPVSDELSALNGVPAITRDARSAPAEPEPTEDPEPAVTEDRTLDEAPAVEAGPEVPSVEKVEGTETPKIVAPADEEPAEPAATTETSSWTQSYSVISQPGSPRLSPKVEPKELEPESQPAESVDIPKTLITPAVEDGDEHVPEPAPEEESKPAWTQSYSVTSQPGSPRISPKQVPEEIPEVEEVEPSWTQSYSVTSQPGSPRISPKEDLPESTPEPIAVADEPTMVVIPPAEEAAPAPAEVESEERPESPWTPSYSVTTLEGQIEQAPPEDFAPEMEVTPTPKNFTEEAPEPQPEVDVPAMDTPAPEPLAVGDEQTEQPQSSWTPSYSVTTLPGSVPAEEAESYPVANKPSVDVEAQAPEQVESVRTVEQPKENGATSDVFEVHEAVTQLAVHDEPQGDVETLEPVPPQLDLVSSTCRCQNDCSVLTTTFSPSRMLPTRSGKPLGPLHTQSRTFRAQAQVWR